MRFWNVTCLSYLVLILRILWPQSCDQPQPCEPRPASRGCVSVVRAGCKFRLPPSAERLGGRGGRFNGCRQDHVAWNHAQVGLGNPMYVVNWTQIWLRYSLHLELTQTPSQSPPGAPKPLRGGGGGAKGNCGSCGFPIVAVGGPSQQSVESRC